jgi:DNA-directed RNA polymerase subunit F
LSKDGQSGLAVTQDGDIVSAFNTVKGRNAIKYLLPLAIKNGGIKLDNFNGNLSRIYEQFGFVPKSRLEFNNSADIAPKNWNYERDGQPDIIFWVHNGDSVDTVINKIGDYEPHDLSKVKLFDKNSYDDARAYRDEAVKETATAEATEKYSVKKKTQEPNIIKPETRGDLTQAKETARKYVKDFDMLDTDTKGRIVEAIISGEQYKVDETTQRAVANILAVRKNLNVSFSNIAENGMYYTIKNEKGATQRYAVINPKCGF